MISQAQVLNKILSTKDYSIITMNELDDRYFSNYKNEFNFIKNHHEIYHVVPDKLTFLNVFPDFDIVDVDEPNNYLLEQLYNDYNREVIAKAFNLAKTMVENDKTDDAITALLKSTEDIHHGAAMQATNILFDRTRFDQYIAKTQGIRDSYIPTGFKELDDKLGGIDRKNENMVIAGRTGQGKTQVLLRMAVNAAMHGETVGIFEGEMTEIKVGYRVDTFLGHISNTSLNRGSTDVVQQYTNYMDNIEAKHCGPIYVMTLESAGGSVTVDTLAAFIEQKHLTMLFVDQYSLMDDLNHGRQEFERVGNIARDIKKLQVRTQIPIISVAQMNRTKTDDGTQDTTQIGLSDKIPQYATTVLMLDRDKKEREKLVINVTKARDGGDGNQFVYRADFDNGRFIYLGNGQEEILPTEETDKLRDDYGEHF